MFRLLLHKKKFYEIMKAHKFSLNVTQHRIRFGLIYQVLGTLFLLAIKFITHCLYYISEFRLIPTTELKRALHCTTIVAIYKLSVSTPSHFGPDLDDGNRLT